MKFVRGVATAFILIGAFFGYLTFMKYLREKEFVEEAQPVAGKVVKVGVPNRKFPDKGRALTLEFTNRGGGVEEVSTTIVSWSGTVNNTIKDGEIGDTKWIFIFPEGYTPNYAHPNYRRVSDTKFLELDFSFAQFFFPLGIALFGILIFSITFRGDFQLERK